MKNNIPLKDLDKLSIEELERVKLLTDIKNAQDSELSAFEKFMKKRMVPFFLPLVTLFVTITFFCINSCDNKKAKALDRYKSELELVKMVWNDMKNKKKIRFEYQSC